MAQGGEDVKTGGGLTPALYPFEGIVSKFTGNDKTHTSTKWIQDIEDNATVFGWNDAQKLIIARRTITGTAELWLRSEKVFKTFEELKAAVTKEFPDSMNIKEVHEMMAARKKKKDETYYEYMLTMKELGRRGKFPDYIIIQYVIDGIPDSDSSKMLLYGATTFTTFKEKLALYESIMNKVRSREPIQQSELRSSKNFYKCGERGHLATACRNGIKCFKCNEFGHTAPSCNKGVNINGRKIREHYEVVSDERGCDSSGAHRGWQSRTMCLNTPKLDVEQNAPNQGLTECQVGGDNSCLQCQHQVKCQSALSVNNVESANKSVKMLEIGGVCVKSLIDSGSDVNLISDDLFFELNVTSYVREKMSFSGLGVTKVYSLGKVECDTKIDGRCFKLVFYIVPKDVMPYKVIVGQPFIQNTTLVFDKGTVNVVPQVHSLFTDSLAGSVDQIACYIPDQKLREEVCSLVQNYQPTQGKEAPIGMHIVLKDEVPVAQRTRRLAIKESQEVDKQIGELLDRGIIVPSFSDYESEAVVKKKDGSRRVCVDYRQVNAQMVKDEFPLPIIKDHIDKLTGAKLDLMFGRKVKMK